MTCHAGSGHRAFSFALNEARMDIFPVHGGAKSSLSSGSPGAYVAPERDAKRESRRARLAHPQDVWPVRQRAPITSALAPTIGRVVLVAESTGSFCLRGWTERKAWVETNGLNDAPVRADFVAVTGKQYLAVAWAWVVSTPDSSTPLCRRAQPDEAPARRCGCSSCSEQVSIQGFHRRGPAARSRSDGCARDFGPARRRGGTPAIEQRMHGL